MSGPHEGGDLIVDLLEAAVRTEGKGQLNVGKVLRAAAAAVARTAAAERGFPTDPEQIGGDVRTLSRRVVDAGLDPAVGQLLTLGAEAITRGQQTGADGFPDPYVCRRCGIISLHAPTSPCDRCGSHPLTFERFRPVYWLRAYRPHEVVERLAANPDLFRAAVRILPADRVDWTPGPGRWSALDVLRHVRDADSVLSERVALILDEEDPSLAFRAVFAWTEDRPDEPESAASVLEAYLASRSATVSRLRRIAPEDWQRTGRHEEFGRVSLCDQASYFAAHELIHLRQLEQLRRALEAAS